MKPQNNKQSIHYEGLYRDNQQAYPEYIFSEEIQTRSSRFKWEIDSHFHSRLYQVFLIEQGISDFITPDNQTTLPAHSLVFIPPNCSHGFHFNESVIGKILTFSSFYINSLKLPDDYQTIVRLTEIQVHSDLSATEFNWFQSLLKQIHQEIFQKNKYRTASLQAYLFHLFIQLQRLQLNQQQYPKGTNRQLEYFKRFLEIINNSEIPLRPLADYAKETGVSVSHLNRICRQLKNQSALEIIHEQLISRAKLFLTHTTYTVNEICYQLGLDNPSYFIRLFKKQTGITPNQFRKEQFRS